MEIFYVYYLAISRWLIPVLSVILAFCWIKYYKNGKEPLRVLAGLTTSDGLNIPITYKENIIGRGKRADVLVPLKSVKTKHALLYVKGGRWFLAPIEGKVQINLQNLSKPAPLDYGDKITISKQELAFKRVADNKTDFKTPSTWLCLLILTVIQLLVLCQILLRFGHDVNLFVTIAFSLLIGGEWLYYIIGRLIKRFSLIFELPMLFLITFGLGVNSSIYPEQLIKQAACHLVGLFLYLVFTFVLRFPEFLEKCRYIFMAITLALLYYTAFFGEILGGAQNWLSVGGFSFQPSELCKVAFVVCGASSLYNIICRPRLKWEFFIFSVLCLGALAIMYDFGAVAIFFVGMLMVLSLRLMHPGIITAITSVATLGGVSLLIFFPHVTRRFSVWLHAWEFADSLGYQQTRTMIAAASGGLLGVGGGNGHLAPVSASDSDLVFGLVSEEWGAVVAIIIALCFVSLGIYAYRLAKNADSSFYSIAVLSSAVMIIFQAGLNIFGSLDLLPLTGVTLIFVSRGGTSIISAWLMLSLFKAAEIHKREISPWRYEE